eukprot:UN29868
MESFVYESQKPLDIRKFKMLLNKIPKIQRIKGFLWFDQFPKTVWTFQVSVRQRYMFEKREDYSGVPKNCIVFINSKIDVKKLEKLLKDCHIPLDSKEINKDIHQKCQTILSSQPSFKVRNIEFQRDTKKIPELDTFKN